MASFPAEVSEDLDAILDQISEGILLLNPQTEIIFSNTAAKQMLQTSTFSDNFFGFSLAKTFRTNQTPEKLPFLWKEKELLLKIKFLGQNLLILIEDRTEAKKLEQLSLRHDRMRELGDMVATVAHEIRNPLGGIRGFATLLHRDLKEQPQHQIMAQHIIDGADHLSQFVTNVLNYSRPTKALLTTMDLNVLVNELCVHVQADSALDSRIQLLYSPNPTPIFAKVDGPLLQSALLNLIVNAIQAMPEGGQLSINIKDGGQQVYLNIRDSGIGISAENIPKLFSPFFTTRANGNGFGLAEVKKIIQALGGTISVTSEIAKGTTFTLQLLKEPLL